MSYWLVKSEPDSYSIDDLAKDLETLWTGVRNYQARNFMTQQMQPGDKVLFYHSSSEPSGIAGLAEVSSRALPDPTAIDKKSDFYDPKASVENPIWQCVKIKFKAKFEHFVSLAELKTQKQLKEMQVLKRGQRLSIQPVSKDEFQCVLALGKIRK